VINHRGLKGRESLSAVGSNFLVELRFLAALQAAGMPGLLTQGIGLRPSALGWNLPTRWAGGKNRDLPLQQSEPIVS
jgi:hypothetical protein